MKHVLDNPAWHALSSANQHLGAASEHSAYFLPDVSPFVALASATEAHLLDLHQRLPYHDRVAILVTTENPEITAPWKMISKVDGFQMVYEGPEKPLFDGPEPLQLTEAHIPEMLALTQLTNPGPFLPRTIDFGHYEGIFENDKLIAMAGQRLHPEGFAEISAVCTHPEHLGKGYARRLLLRQVNRIQEAGETPFLHAKADNERAIKIYESLGFRIRTEMFFYILMKA
ncbi:GNAT family N-acetyltransferase [Dyadobacter luticola]|uniref:GNAT family N-acetyltransferase n=1 Tax=Dyadobacter luticola TaxID=1979387 RepID=A0A5R9L6G2_9BACT|nr:GNAT family N-acetyltransferase [Dyadobacter luticola]TLV03860.1 GNAT family N-acetyltransferase [Dyadobacter luticola]